jgi:hypothetical protein
MLSFAQVSINADQTLPDSSAMLDVKSSTKGFLPPRMTAVQMNAILAPSNGLLVYNNTMQSLYWYDGSAWRQFSDANPASCIHTTGENYGGGIVFYVYDNGQHGLIAAVSDEGYGVQWYNGTYRSTGSAGDGTKAGAMNTCLIISAQLSDNQLFVFAAGVCADYSVAVGDVTYGDWYLPSKHELNLLYQQKVIVGGFSNGDYWSSTEINANEAWSQYFYDGTQSGYPKDGILLIRPIRAF